MTHLVISRDTLATFVGDGKESFIGFDHTLKGDFGVTLLAKSVQYLVPPTESGGIGNVADFSSLADGEAEAHTFDVLMPDREGFLSLAEDGFTGDGEHSAAILATVLLLTVSILAELLDVFDATTNRAEDTVGETAFFDVGDDVFAVVLI